MSNIKSRFPSKLMIREIRKGVEMEIRNKKLSSFAEQMIDVDKKVYDLIKLKMLKDNFDPFVQKFVDTQIVTIELLKWSESNAYMTPTLITTLMRERATTK